MRVTNNNNNIFKGKEKRSKTSIKIECNSKNTKLKKKGVEMRRKGGLVKISTLLTYSTAPPS